VGTFFLIFLAIVFKSYRAKFNIRKPIDFIFQNDAAKSSDFTGLPSPLFPLFFLSHVGYARRNHQRRDSFATAVDKFLDSSYSENSCSRQRIAENVDGGFTMFRDFEAQRN
jgi:hypothetical protein